LTRYWFKNVLSPSGDAWFIVIYYRANSRQWYLKSPGKWRALVNEVARIGTTTLASFIVKNTKKQTKLPQKESKHSIWNDNNVVW
jgi:hypothetical protein